MSEKTESKRTPESWHALDAERGIYEATYHVPGLSCRSVAAGLEGGGLVIYSPGGSLAADLPSELTTLGEPKVLLAPNSFHHLGIKRWRELYPETIAVAASDAMSRLAKQGHADLQPLARLRERLPAHLDVFEVPGTRVGETWLRFESAEGIGWVICDAFFNLPRLSHKLHLRLLSKLMSSGPGLAISSLMKWGGVNNRKLYKGWLLEQLERDQPTILVPNHGDVLRGAELPARLRELIERRL
ncbi:MAG: hypothetical protein KC609_12030 [Myxococcales bacterium]|nr:hypothetical protein [Myxococcales bacterium]